MSAATWDSSGVARYISLVRRMTSLTDTAHRAASQYHRTSCTSTSHVSFPSGDCFLILLGHSKWQHLDFKVNVKGSFVFKNETKDKQQMLGCPEITFCTVAYVSVSKLQIWLDPDWNTYHAMQQTTPKGDPTSWTRKVAQQPVPSGRPLHDHLRIAQHYLQIFGNGRRELEQSYLTPLLLF